MTDNNAIQLISGQLLPPYGAASPEPNPLFAKLAQKYPYFLPLRYVKAKAQHNESAFSNEMLSAAYPYVGNWILFSDFVQGVQPMGSQQSEPAIEEAAPAPVVAEAPEAIETVAAAPAEKEEAAIEEVIVQEVIVEDAIVEINEAEAQTEEISIATEEALTELTAEPLPAATELVMEDWQPARILLKEEELMDTPVGTPNEEVIFSPVFSEDYFLQQGIKVSGEIPEDVAELTTEEITTSQKDKALMVMMSFKDWLLHFKNSSQKQIEELEDKKAVKTMWQKEKLAAAMQEENEEIPENVFEMAVNSITSEEGLASESLAEIYLKQQKYDKAVEMYRKLSLRNPEKNVYFAQKIKDILKEKEL